MENQEKKHTEFNDFQHGYTSGLEDVEKDNYEGYVRSQVKFEWLGRLLDEKKGELSEVKNLIEWVKGQQKTAFDSLQVRLGNFEIAQKNKLRLDEQAADFQEKITYLNEKRKTTAQKYSLLAGIIYFFAGIAFVAGDLIISHEIVAYALNIRNDVESWSFAVGLAMISVLLKPAYERLIESPYAENPSPRSKKVYAWFKGTMVLFATLTLFILGWFRYEAYKTEKMKEAINKSIKNIQNEAFDPLNPTAPQSPQVTQQIDAKLKTFDGLTLDLVNSPWALASFVLSGILFALAGAVCLGISFPILQAYWSRWVQIDPRIKRYTKAKSKLTPALEEAEKAFSDQLTQKTVLENEIKLLPPLTDLEEQKHYLLKEIEAIQEEMLLAETDARTKAFKDGYSKGEVVKNVMEKDELNQFVRDTYFTSSSLAAKANGSSAEKSISSKRPPLRPYQQLRKLISEDFEGGKEGV